MLKAFPGVFLAFGWRFLRHLGPVLASLGLILALWESSLQVFSDCTKLQPGWPRVGQDEAQMGQDEAKGRLKMDPVGAKMRPTNARKTLGRWQNMFKAFPGVWLAFFGIISCHLGPILASFEP